jgi:hypothetical protein
MTDRERIDRYLDGQLDAGERASFEAALAHDSSLRAEVELQRRIDGALEAAVPHGDPDAILARARAAVVARPRPRRLVRVALVLGVFLLVLGALAWWLAPAPEEAPQGYKRGPPRPLEVIYADRVQTGFKPDWVCKDEKEFADTFKKELGVPLAFAPTPQVAMVGLAYTTSLSSQTVAFLAHVDGREVIVFLDTIKHDSHPKLPAGSTLHIFRSELGGLVLYELTPLDEPHAAALFKEAGGK